jgi:uncharacterized membrane protein YGL010W
MKTLADQLSNYATYHRSARNIATHLVGIPMIILAISALLSRPTWTVGAIPVSPALLASAAILTYYLLLDVTLGSVMCGLFGLALWFGSWAAGLDTAGWLAVGAGGFVVGWIMQFIGHHFEGRKPAFLDDLAGLAIGPLFVVAEVLFKVGAFASLRKQIEQRAGAVRG